MKSSAAFQLWKHPWLLNTELAGAYETSVLLTFPYPRTLHRQFSPLRIIPNFDRFIIFVCKILPISSRFYFIFFMTFPVFQNSSDSKVLPSCHFLSTKKKKKKIGIFLISNYHPISSSKLPKSAVLTFQKVRRNFCCCLIFKQRNKTNCNTIIIFDRPMSIHTCGLLCALPRGCTARRIWQSMEGV